MLAAFAIAFLRLLRVCLLEFGVILSIDIKDLLDYGGNFVTVLSEEIEEFVERFFDEHPVIVNFSELGLTDLFDHFFRGGDSISSDGDDFYGHESLDDSPEVRLFLVFLELINHDLVGGAFQSADSDNILAGRFCDEEHPSFINLILINEFGVGSGSDDLGYFSFDDILLLLV